jgi:plasmid stabilization system protein ParE
VKRWPVILELAALRDIEEGHRWLAERDPNAADRWFNGIYDTIGSLEVFPERCPLAPESEFLNLQIRELFHGRRQHKYRILFRVSETTATFYTSATARVAPLENANHLKLNHE